MWSVGQYKVFICGTHWKEGDRFARDAKCAGLGISGIDDCGNILTVLITLAQDGLVLENNGMNKPKMKK